MRRLWATLGLLATLAIAPLANAAGWLPLVNPPLPADAVPSVWTANYATAALTNNWLNSNFADVISTGPVTTTIKFISGKPDVATLATLMGVSATTGIGGLAMSKWYDQSGHGNDCTQATGANQLYVWLINGKVYVAGDGYLANFWANSSSLSKYCTLPAGVATNNQASSVY